MKIAILQDRLRSGGTERQTLWLASWLSEQGHAVCLIVFRPGGELAEQGGAGPFERKMLQPLDLGMNFLAPGLDGALRSFDPEAVVLMGRMANNRGRQVRAAVPKARLLATARTGKRLPTGNLRSFAEADVLVSNSAWWVQYAEGLGVRPRRLEVVYNALTRPWKEAERESARAALRDELGVAKEAVVSICVAGLRAGKRHALLMEAWSDARRGEQDELWLVGEGAERARCEGLCSSLPGGERVRLLGFCDDPFALYAAADVALSASAEDSQPNFLVEAQWMGLPVVASDCRGVIETFVPGESGLLVPMQGDERAALAEAFTTLFSDGKRRAQYSQRAAAFARERFEADASGRRWLDLLQTPA